MVDINEIINKIKNSLVKISLNMDLFYFYILKLISQFGI